MTDDGVSFQEACEDVLNNEEVYICNECELKIRTSQDTHCILFLTKNNEIIENKDITIVELISKWYKLKSEIKPLSEKCFSVYANTITDKIMVVRVSDLKEKVNLILSDICNCADFLPREYRIIKKTFEKYFGEELVE